MKPKLLALLLSIMLNCAWSQAKISWVDVGVDGLTCSMCTRTVEMSIRKLIFVDSVNMDLEKTEGRVYFREGTSLNFGQVAKAIRDAGFSVRFVRASFNLSALDISMDGCFQLDNMTFQWIQFEAKEKKGMVTLSLVDEGFLPHKQSAHWKKKWKPDACPEKSVIHVAQE